MTRHSATPEKPAAKVVDIFTDGACSGNPGAGGWGVLLRYDGREKELHGGEAATTNNRMELMAAIKALESLKRPAGARPHTDSRYMMKGAKYRGGQADLSILVSWITPRRFFLV